MYCCEGMFTALLPSNRSLQLRGADHIKNTSTVLLAACVCWTVYRAVTWQRVEQICYNILFSFFSFFTYLHPFSFVPRSLPPPPPRDIHSGCLGHSRRNVGSCCKTRNRDACQSGRLRVGFLCEMPPLTASLFRTSRNSV
jgi:hypothetical protein